MYQAVYYPGRRYLRQHFCSQERVDVRPYCGWFQELSLTGIYDRSYQLSAINTGIIDSSCSNLVPGNTICLGYAGEDCSTTYTVVPDDSCDQIAANHGFNTTILALNNPQIDSDCTNLYVGEVLCVAEKVQVPPHPSGALPGATIPVTAAPAKPTSSHVHSAPAATPAPDSDGKDDDDDLPFCDEL
ncbi:hypothetical protein DXG01_011547 [Tephrocybe rancida]|nr:hypothetical protein DXG01_011547 [Tephrocybe rancida]